MHACIAKEFNIVSYTCTCTLAIEATILYKAASSMFV